MQGDAVFDSTRPPERLDPQGKTKIHFSEQTTNERTVVPTLSDVV
jgi:hypothetical protein